jgi:uncharacterized iron-regulated protein
MQSQVSTVSSVRRSPTTANGSPPRCGIAHDALCHAFGALLLLALVTGCTSAPRHPHHSMHHGALGPGSRSISGTPAVNLHTLSDLESLIPRLAERRVVLVGETHDRLDHHLAQLEVIRGLHAIHPRLAIGMEMFQQPFQRHLDDYVAGELSETELLRKTEYYQRWRFDFRLYQPILRYARENRLPLVALNLPAELTRKVGREGIDGLSDEERAKIPQEIDRSDSAYEGRLREIFEQHPKRSNGDFERFLAVQLLWDEGMAERAARFLESHPDHAMVILAGSGHIAHRSGIPRRLVRRIPVSTAIVLLDWRGDLGPELGDYLLLTQERRLPPAGKIGAVLREDEGQLEIVSCGAGSACQEAGLKKGDRVVSIDGEPVTSMADLKLRMWDKSPGDQIALEVLRNRWLSGPRLMTREVTLK